MCPHTDCDVLGCHKTHGEASCMKACTGSSVLAKAALRSDQMHHGIGHIPPLDLGPLPGATPGGR